MGCAGGGVAGEEEEEEELASRLPLPPPSCCILTLIVIHSGAEYSLVTRCLHTTNDTVLCTTQQRLRPGS